MQKEEHRSGFERRSFRDVFWALRQCDIAIEVVDARDIGGTRITRFDRTFTSKLLIVATKKDTLVGVKLPPKTVEGYPIFYVSTKTMDGKKELMEKLHSMEEEILQRRKDRRNKRRDGREADPIHLRTGFAPDMIVRVMVFGIPNVGKSSLINMIAQRRAAAAGFKAGVTKGPQWIRIGPHMLLCDSPGVIALRESAEELALKSAFNIEQLEDPEIVAEELVRRVVEEKSKGLARFYKIEMSSNYEEVLERIAIARHFVKKGGEPDVQRACMVLLRDFQKGKFVL